MTGKYTDKDRVDEKIGAGFCADAVGFLPLNS
jgi:hypothetical protein